MMISKIYYPYFEHYDTDQCIYLHFKQKTNYLRTCTVQYINDEFLFSRSIYP